MGIVVTISTPGLLFKYLWSSQCLYVVISDVSTFTFCRAIEFRSEKYYYVTYGNSEVVVDWLRKRSATYDDIWQCGENLILGINLMNKG